ncbi:hypothetical protein NST17_19575 [Caldifermentibacillus hisashii]|uniref:Uncharacterized protein n=1 Tax=Caldifermentibacillus hisashii TaxID=996558 RepID=A0ABU9K4X4_9BACI
MAKIEYRKCAAYGCENKIVKNRKQLYCSATCRERMKAIRRRGKRIRKNLCPQCGKEMDFPVSDHRNKVYTSYCSKCKLYYKSRYKDKFKADLRA